MIKTILFDFDGTLADTLDLVMEYIDTSADKYQYQPIRDKETFRSHKLMDLLQGQRKHRWWTILRYVWKAQGYLKKNSARITFFPGIPKLIHQLAAQYTLGIITINRRSTVQRQIHREGCDVFTYIASGLLGHKATSIKKALKKLQLATHEVIYIGDETSDIVACRQAGIKMIAVNRGYDNAELLATEHPDIIVHTPLEIIKAIKHLESQGERK